MNGIVEQSLLDDDSERFHRMWSVTVAVVDAVAQIHHRLTW